MKADTGSNTPTVARCLVEGWHMAFISCSPRDWVKSNWIYWQNWTMRQIPTFILLYLLLVCNDEDEFLWQHTDLSFKSCHSPQAQLGLAHAAIFNPGGTWLTIGIASEYGRLHFYSWIHWKIHRMTPPPVLNKNAYFLPWDVWVCLILLAMAVEQKQDRKRKIVRLSSSV